MEDNRKERTTLLLEKIKNISSIYILSTYNQKIRLLDVGSVYCDELCSFGYPRYFIEGVMMFGKDFLDMKSIKDAWPQYYQKYWPEVFKIFQN